MPTKTTISRPFDTTPDEAFRSLARAIDAYIRTREGDGTSWSDLDELLVAVGRSVRYGDSRCRDECLALVHPHRLTPDSEVGWLAHYQCPDHGRIWSSWWADDLGGW